MIDPQKPRRWKVAFAGSPAYAVPSLQALCDDSRFDVVCVISQEAKARGRGLQPQSSPVASFAEARGLLVLTPETLKNQEFAGLLRGCTPDVGVVVAYGKILPRAILALLPHGWVNAHASLLPRWRGASPIQQALLAGDPVTGVTLMQLDVGMDTGPTFAREEVAILPEDTGGTLAERCSQSSARLLIQHLEAFLNGDIQMSPQPTTGVTTARLLGRADAELHFTEPAAHLARQVRAFSPWPGTYCTLGSTFVKVLRAHAGEGTAELGNCTALPEGFGIGTAKGLLVPTLVQVPGKKPIPGSAFRNGYPKLFQHSAV